MHLLTVFTYWHVILGKFSFVKLWQSTCRWRCTCRAFTRQEQLKLCNIWRKNFDTIHPTIFAPKLYSWCRATRRPTTATSTWPEPTWSFWNARLFLQTQPKKLKKTRLQNSTKIRPNFWEKITIIFPPRTLSVTIRWAIFWKIFWDVKISKSALIFFHSHFPEGRVGSRVHVHCKKERDDWNKFSNVNQITYNELWSCFKCLNYLV